MAKKAEQKRGLGRGLSALLGDEGADLSDPTPATDGTALRGASPIAIDLIAPNPHQPRRTFDEDDLEELAASIRHHGILQPIVLRPNPAGKPGYEIVAGERRWRAAQRAQLHEIPAVVRTLDDRTVLEIAIVENVQRADLNPVEEAQGYAQLIESFGHTQADLARIVGKSRSHLANMLRLLTLPDAVRAMITDGQLSAGHARALVTAPDPVSLANKVVEQGLSVRDTEALARRATAPATPARPRNRPEKDADTRALEGDLSAAIGMSVRIDHAGHDGGELRIRYRDLEQLDQLCQKLAD